jgi:hypothetical protein
LRFRIGFRLVIVAVEPFFVLANGEELSDEAQLPQG